MNWSDTSILTIFTFPAKNRSEATEKQLCALNRRYCRRSSVAQRRCDALAFATADDQYDSQFISDKVAGRVCVFSNPSKCTSWYMYQHIHTHTNIRKPFLFSSSLTASNFTQSDLNWFNYSEATKTLTFKCFCTVCQLSSLLPPNCQSFSVFITIPLATIIIKGFWLTFIVFDCGLFPR